MPVISIQIGKLSQEQKKEVIKKITTTTSEITKIPESAFTVIIQEFEDENIGIGGKDICEIKKLHNK